MGRCRYLFFDNPKSAFVRIIIISNFVRKLPWHLFRAGLAINGSGVIRISLENEHEPIKSTSNQNFLWAVFIEELRKVVLIFFVVADQLSNAWIAGFLLAVGIGFAIAL